MNFGHSEEFCETTPKILKRRVLGKLIKKEKIIGILNQENQKRFIWKLLIRDYFGCIEIFISKFKIPEVGEIIEARNIKMLYLRGGEITLARTLGYKKSNPLGNLDGQLGKNSNKIKYQKINKIN